LIPVQIGTPSQFAIVREFLRNTGYSGPAICKHLGMPEISSFISGERPVFPPGPSTPLDLLIRAFFIGSYIPERGAADLFSREVLEAMRALGLLLADREIPDLLYSPVMLYPAYGIYAASDRYTRPNGTPIDTGDDFVFPAISPHSGHFLAILPESRCERFLDVGAGTGIAAIGAATRYAAHSWSLDITARATAFALWNKELNGVGNVTVLEGDMFAPVAGETFDRIVMHPPYDVSLGHRAIYCNGGDDGESIVRRLFQEAPAYLAPGGRLYVLARIADLLTEPLEQRLRGWLGEWSEECDIAVIVRELTSPDDVALATFVSSRGTHDELTEYKLRLDNLGVEQLCYACIVVQRRCEERPTFTLRRERGTSWESAAVERLLGVETALTADPEEIWNLPLRKSPHLEMIVKHGMRNGRLVPVECTLRVQDPFKVEMQVEPGIVWIVERCDGAQTPAELHRGMVDSGLFPADAGEGAFREIVAALVSAGILYPAGATRRSGSQPVEALA
jgi:SAM-dependent methyltransferase